MERRGNLWVELGEAMKQGPVIVYVRTTGNLEIRGQVVLYVEGWVKLLEDSRRVTWVNMDAIATWSIIE